MKKQYAKLNEEEFIDFLNDDNSKYRSITHFSVVSKPIKQIIKGVEYKLEYHILYENA